MPHQDGRRRQLKTEWILAGVVTVLTLTGLLLVLRWLAPQLIGLPVDLRLVGVSETRPAFYDGAFRSEDFTSQAFLINDPVTVVRARPLAVDPWGYGPHDLLGFRNQSIPNVADVVVVGDSQTYGNDVLLEQNWPSRLQAGLAGQQAIVYAMATGGWGAAQYLEMARLATALKPQLIIVAFYSGNDAVESFRLAYGVERFHDLRPDLALTPEDAPKLVFPPPRSELWPVIFDDGVSTVFTPRLRLLSNLRSPVVDAGYAVMAAAAQEIRRLTQAHQTRLLFTIIPTKELVHAPKLSRDGRTPDDAYRALVDVERERIAEFAAALNAIEGARYVDLVAPLQQAALAATALYPGNDNGHPAAAGHRVIARVLGAAAGAEIKARPRGLVAPGGRNDAGGVFLASPDGRLWSRPDLASAFASGWRDDTLLYVATAHGLWRFADLATALASGWQLEQVQVVSQRSLAGLPRLGVVEAPDARRFGPPL